ncbi:MAG: aspartate carbamoyltransferase catalytic subunit [Synergistetes bacterium]|nr:aspartate carbamoyltransferase catalytic subunit [Synergistota bacterium]MDW8192887.1 aspartate carbamoyltransferase catalytic subunit [Synergistota bacterium]
MEWRHKHLFDIDDWSREDIESVLNLASEFERRLDSKESLPSLKGRTLVNFFLESSTRTRVSFEIAAKLLGINVMNWATASSSMAVKGESLKDTVWTLESMGVDMIVIRSSWVGAPQYIARKARRARVINAGDGTHAHPTQALLDIYTAWKRFGSLEGKRVLIAGDIVQSRVARSDIIGFKKMGAYVFVSGPRNMVPLHLDALGVSYEPDFIKAVKEADVIYLLRVQKERWKASAIPSDYEYHMNFGCREEVLKEAKPEAIVMHPGPINRGVELSSEVADGPQSLILEQVRNGVMVRTALLYLYLGGER